MIALPRRLVLATHNKDKIAEFATLLRPLGVELVPAAALGLAQVGGALLHGT